MRWGSWVVVGLFMTVVPRPASALTAAILKLGGAGEDEALRTSLVDALAAEVARQPEVRVITRNELDSMLGLEKLKDAMGCSDSTCLAEIAGAIGADRLLSGTLAHTRQAVSQQEFYSLTVQWLDARTAAVLGRETVTWEGGTEGLYQLLPSLVLKLVLGPAVQAARGQLVVTTAVSDARVLIEGQEVGRTPLLAPLTLPIGKATVDVLADDFEPFRAVVIIDRDCATGLVASLVEKPSPPLYSRWWFWGAAAGVVAGGAAATYLLTRPEAEKSASGTFEVPAPAFGVWQ